MQVVNGSTPFQTPNSGTGAVIFDFPNEQPLDMLLKANDDLDKYNQLKALKIAQDTKARQDMFANIKFDTKGALPQDIQTTIAPKSEEVFDLAAKVFSYPQGSKEFMQGMVELKRKQAEVERLIQSSAGFKDVFAELQKPLDPNKNDVDETNFNSALLSAAPLEKRIELSKQMGSPFVPNKTSFFDLIKTDYEKLPKSEEVVVDAKGNPVIENLPSGGKLYSKSKGFTEQDITNLGSVYFNSPSKVDKATSEYNELANADPIMKAAIDQEATKRGISPIKVYIEDNLRKLPRAITKDKVDEGYAWKKSVDYGFDNKKDEDNAKYISEQLGNMISLNDAAYNIPNTIPNAGAQSFQTNDFSKPTFDAGGGIADVQYGNTLRGTNAGVFSYQYQDENGQVKTDVKPNVILGNKRKGGVPYIQTSESISNIGGMLNGQKVDDEGYIPLDNNIITSIYVANKIPLGTGRKTLVAGNAYGGNTPQTEKMATQQKTTTQPKTKTYTIKGKKYPESKVAEKAKASGMSIAEYIKAVNQ